MTTLLYGVPEGRYNEFVQQVMAEAAVLNIEVRIQPFSEKPRVDGRVEVFRGKWIELAGMSIVGGRGVWTIRPERWEEVKAGRPPDVHGAIR